MIVKLLKSGTSDWVMFDEIRKILKISEEFDFDPMNHPVDLSNHVKYSDYRLFDTWYKLSESNGVGKVGIVTFECRLDDRSEYIISFDTQAYICNDEGRTIEKVVATS